MQTDFLCLVQQVIQGFYLYLHRFVWSFIVLLQFFQHLYNTFVHRLEVLPGPSAYQRHCSPVCPHIPHNWKFTTGKVKTEVNLWVLAFLSQWESFRQNRFDYCIYILEIWNRLVRNLVTQLFHGSLLEGKFNIDQGTENSKSPMTLENIAINYCIFVHTVPFTHQKTIKIKIPKIPTQNPQKIPQNLEFSNMDCEQHIRRIK